MGRALWLADVLRSGGVPVQEVDGWKTRGSTNYGPIEGIIIHATAGSRTATPLAELNVLINGSASAPPPIAQLMLDRSGRWYVVASGLCFHALNGFSGTRLAGVGNSRLIGIEAMNDNRGEPWPAVQYASYCMGVAALVRHLGIPLSNVIGHKEHQPGDKSDPTFNMNDMRARIKTYIVNPDADSLEDEMWAQRTYELLDKNIRYQGNDTIGGRPIAYTNGAIHDVSVGINELRFMVAGLTSTVNSLVEIVNRLTSGDGDSTLDSTIILNGVNEMIASAVREMQDTVADSAEGGADKVRSETGVED